jgi:asparagine synthase (glutamine-hydrolysing)
MSEDAIDLKYAKEVADFIGSDHTEVIITREDVISSITEVVKSLESWDITTIRASLGMYLICKYIKEKTDIKVLMTGEVSDEIFGYKYTDYAPSPLEFQKEASKRVKELYIYDVLRADRCISAHSLEARVPFSDTDFVQYVMAINPEKKMNTYGQGKYILRKAFEGDYLPDSILYREKAAFSDAVGHSLVDCIKEYAETLYTDIEYEKKIRSYKHGVPFTKESLMFREIFESFYTGRSMLIKDFWMPNKEWENCDVLDPSARVLPNYGLSGS